jgi:hypothetical protein
VIPSKPQALPQEEIPDVPAPAATLQMTTVDAAIPSVIVFDPKLPPFQAD